jgi:hypothetical protein
MNTQKAPKLWPTTLTRNQLVEVIGVPPERLDNWANRRRAIVPISHDRGNAGARYALTAAVLGVVLREMQKSLGEKSAVAFAIVEALRPKVGGPCGVVWPGEADEDRGDPTRGSHCPARGRPGDVAGAMRGACTDRRKERPLTVGLPLGRGQAA